MGKIVYIVSVYRSAVTNNATYHTFFADAENVQEAIKEEDARVRKEFELSRCVDTDVFENYEDCSKWVSMLFRLYNGKLGSF